MLRNASVVAIVASMFVIGYVVGMSNVEGTIAQMIRSKAGKWSVLPPVTLDNNGVSVPLDLGRAVQIEADSPGLLTVETVDPIHPPRDLFLELMKGDKSKFLEKDDPDPPRLSGAIRTGTYIACVRYSSRRNQCKREDLTGISVVRLFYVAVTRSQSLNIAELGDPPITLHIAFRTNLPDEINSSLQVKWFIARKDETNAVNTLADALANDGVQSGDATVGITPSAQGEIRYFKPEDVDFANWLAGQVRSALNLTLAPTPLFSDSNFDLRNTIEVWLPAFSPADIPKRADGGVTEIHCYVSKFAILSSVTSILKALAPPGQNVNCSTVIAGQADQVRYFADNRKAGAEALTTALKAQGFAVRTNSMVGRYPTSYNGRIEIWISTLPPIK